MTLKQVKFGILLGMVACLCPASFAAGDPWEKIERLTLNQMAAKGSTVVIVRLKADAAAASPESMKTVRQRVLKKLTAEPGLHVRHEFSTVPYVVAEVDYSALGALAALDEVEAIEADRRVKPADVESNARIGATTVQQPPYGYTGAGINVGIIDSGIDLNHPDLAGSMTIGRRILHQQQIKDGNVQDDVGHGSHVAGVITSNGTVVPKGVAPDAKLVVVKALDADGGWVSDVAAGIDWIVQQNANLSSKVRFINLSIFFVCADNDPNCLGELPAQCPCDNITGYNVFKASVSAAATAGITCISSAGNDGETVLRVPGCLSNVVSVGATFDASFQRAPAAVLTNPNATFRSVTGNPLFAACRHSTTVQPDWLVCFSNRNPAMSFVAPGYLISSVSLGDNAHALHSYGTSQATAHVTAALGLLQQAVPNKSNAQLIQLLHSTAVKVPENPSQPSGQKYDRIDVLAAINLATRNDALDWIFFP